VIRMKALHWLACAAVVIAVQAAGQTPPKNSVAKNWTPPRTSDGKPDLQGVWTNVTITPLERPAELKDKPFFTAAEAAQYEKDVVQRNNADRRDGSAEADVGRAYNNFWYDRGTKVIPALRTSLIVDPPDGRIPPLTPAAQQRVAAQAEARRLHPADGPEDRALTERCILWPTVGPPMLPGPYNNNYQIVQGQGYVMIVVEMIHDVRIIPTDGRPHLPSNIRQWMGDSRGRWEGNTLVVDTTNFTGKTTFRGSDESLHLVERFTRAGPDMILYEFTVDDPASFTKPWTAQVPMVKMDGPVVEYACHEGNYAMSGILGGARADEKAKAGEDRGR
jgi:hypothetical protein